ncbi:MAG: dprA [Hydrocarboniphaga sp.]|uniref:DNA-processing protein DprA n=1 Tax=Hydrocarboniphaga sp. TaxID=2033016 RepID=UPI0026332E82|nr:DNA-processing protein DprA [Hydrocarboniphaga sp.]MDB5968266.1 dprA [Hydrocarboniphaga sp.]
MNDEDLRAWLWLLRAPGVSPPLAVRLIEQYGDAATVLAAGRGNWSRLGLSREACTGLAEPDRARVDLDLAWLAGAADRHLIVYTDPRYPQRLREIDAAPAALFGIGDVELLRQPQIGVVGSRHATAQGLDTAQSFAAALVGRGLVVTSGLALGIDGAAHRGALAAGGPTIAVCATGLDRVYPARHKELAHAIVARGLLVSEFSPGMPPLAENFPQRNRLISGLSLGILVVEAARESGSLITARLAAEQGREVFAIPGSIHNPLARGCHQLLRQGARLVETVDDIVEELSGVLAAALSEALADPGAAAADTSASTKPTIESEPARDLRGIWQAIGDEPTSVDRLIERLQTSAEALSVGLLELELEGWVATDSSGRVIRRVRAEPQ